MNDAGSDSSFALTRWTLVLRARGETPEARAALSELCAAYYLPVFRFLRCEGREDDTARELAQEFFARVLAGRGLGGAQPEQGRFRSFLLGAVKHFLADVRDRERRLKRGGGRVPESLEAGTLTSPGIEIAAPEALAPDAWFDREWALAVVERAVQELAREQGEAGKAGQFEILKPWLLGEVEGLSSAVAAQRLGVSEVAAKVAIHRLRQRFREAVRREIAPTVAGEEEIAGELRYLVEALAQGAR